MSLMDSLMYATNGSGSVAALEHDGSNNLKVAITSNTSGTGDASAANQATQITNQGTANGHLSTLAGAVSGTEMQVDIVSSSGTLLVDGSASTQPVSAASLPLPSGASTSANQSTANGHLSTLAGAVSGTEMQVDIVSSSGTLLVDGSASTQPVSAASLPLPSGASTSANQSTANSSLSSIDTQATALNGKVSQGYDSVIASGGNGAQQVLIYGRDTGGNLDALHTNTSGDLNVEIADFTKGQAVMASSFPVVISSDQSTLNVDGSGSTQPVSAASLPLPSGASTSANQSTANGHLSTLAGAVSGTEMQVDIVSSATLTTNTDKTSATSSLWSSQSLTAGSTNNTSGVLDFQDYSVLQVVGNTTNTTDPIYMEFSTDNITYYRDNMNTIYPDSTSGDFVVSFSDVACRYIRAVKDNNGAGAETITLKAAVRKN